MIKYAKLLTPCENSILVVAAEIGFGELKDVEVLLQKYEIPVQITASQEKFIDILRMGFTQINRIIVHNHEPVSVEIDGCSHGIRYTKKIKV